MMKSGALFLAVLMASVPAAAQQAALSVQTVVMTEREAVAAATDASPELQRLVQRAAARRVGADFARYDLRNPELRIQDISTEYFDSDANHRFQIGLRWHLPRFGEVDENVALARWEYQDAVSDAFEYRMSLVNDVRLAVLDVAMLAEEISVAERREALEAKRVDVLGRLAELGSVPFLRRIKAQTSMLKARRDLASLRKGLAAARQRLALLVGNDFPVDVEALEIPEAELDLARLIRKASVVRPESSLEATRTALARASRRAEVLDMIPTFRFVQASYHHESRDSDWGELSFGIEIPVFNWSRHKLRRADMALASREDNSSSGMDEVKGDISRAFRDVAETREAWLALRDQVALARDEVAALAVVARSKGIQEDEVLELELSGVELESMMVSARRDYAQALIELCTAAGVEDFDELAGD